MVVDVSGVLFRADALTDLGQHGKAISLLGTALAEAPGDGRLLAQLAEALSKGGRSDEAIDAARSALAVDPGMVAPRVTLTKVALRQDRFDDALDLAEELLETQPMLPQAHIFRAIALAYGPDAALSSVREQARDSVQRALEDGGGEPAYFHWAAEVERRLGDEDAAVHFARTGLAVDPTSPALLEFLALSRTTPTQEGISILSGLLAENPMEQSFRARILRVHRANRRSRYDLQWMSVIAVSVVLTAIGGILSVIGVALIALVTYRWWRRLDTAVSTLPEALRSTRRGTATDRVRRAALVGFGVTAILGTALLIAESSVGSILLVGSIVAWAVGSALVDAEELRAATLEDELSGSTEVGIFARLQLGRTLRTAGVLVALGIVGLIQGAPLITALCDVTAVVLVVEGFVFAAKSSPFRPGVIAAVLLTVLGLLAGGHAALALTQFPTRAGWTAPAADPSDDAPSPGRTPAQTPIPFPSSFDGPVPSFSVPSFDIPSISIPPLTDPPAPS